MRLLKGYLLLFTSIVAWLIIWIVGSLINSFYFPYGYIFLFSGAICVYTTIKRALSLLKDENEQKH